MSDFWSESNHQDWESDVRQKLLPMLQESGACITLVPRGELDIKFAVELGLCIMMELPVIALVRPGMSIPNGLAAVAAEIVEVDLARDPDGAQRSITEAFARVVHADERHISLEDLEDD